MVSVLPATVARTVRTVAAALWAVEGMLLACELAAEAAVMPPMAATAARLRLAMMIRGCLMISSLGSGYVGFSPGRRVFTRQAGFPALSRHGCRPGGRRRARPAGLAARADHAGLLYSGARSATGRPTVATLAAWIRARQAPSPARMTSRMITDSTLSAAMPSGQC